MTPNIEMNLKKIQRFSQTKQDENWEFYSFLKGYTSDQKMDDIVHHIYEQIAPKIDCTTCANCCKTLDIIFQEEDLNMLAQGMGISSHQFRTQYVNEHTEFGMKTNELILKEKPCPFLANNRCNFYAYRPETCKTYPYLQKEDFLCRLHGVINNYAICPIVFNVCESLKDELGFNNKYHRRNRKGT